MSFLFPCATVSVNLQKIELSFHFMLTKYGYDGSMIILDYTQENIQSVRIEILKRREAGGVSNVVGRMSCATTMQFSPPRSSGVPRRDENLHTQGATVISFSKKLLPVSPSWRTLKWDRGVGH